MQKIPDEIRKQIEEKYPKTFMNTGIWQDDNTYQRKRDAAEFGYSLASKSSHPEQGEQGELYRLKMVVGFMFNEAETLVLLIHKQKPDWQKNKFNGIGGKVEQGETFLQAMIREFKEETGIGWHDWKPVTRMYGRDWEVQVFCAFTDNVFQFKQMEDERVMLVDLVKQFPVYNKVSNLNWLIPMCLDDADIDYSFSNDGKLSSPPPQDERKGGLPKSCKDKKRGKNDVCKYPIGSCELCQNNF